jgi:hypothetical protein
MSAPLPPFGPEHVSRTLARTFPRPATCTYGQPKPCTLAVAQCPCCRDSIAAALEGFRE